MAFKLDPFGVGADIAGGFLDAGGVEAIASGADLVGGAAESNWFDDILGGLSTFSSWLEDNPVSAKLIGGALTGLANSYEKDKDREALAKRYQISPSAASSEPDRYMIGGTGLLASPYSDKKKV